MFSPVRHASLNSLVVRPLIHAIFTGQLPGGTRLIEKELASQFEVSSLPIREALREIASMGLVELRPNRGAVVLDFNPDSLRDIYHVRMALESEATRLATPGIPRSDVETLEKAFLKMLAPAPRNQAWSMRVVALDEQFHDLITTWAGRPRLSLEIHRYRQLAHFLDQDIREFQGYDSAKQEDSIRHHLTIVHALRQGDAESAALAMRTHLLLAVEGAVNAFFSNRKP
jgi:DNA-binding GntR family transcriptional regulator